jgi:endonuclease/exonuclease/phosphatase (EEP) superfamily protein YafD
MRLTRQRLTASLGAVGLSVALPLAGLSVPASMAGASAAEGADDLHIATLNVHGELSIARAYEDISDLAATEADVIGLQEMGGRARRDYVREHLVDCADCVWDAHMPIGGPEASVPVLYRSDRFELEAEGSRKVSDATYVGPEGAGPSTLKAKYINWVVLRQLSTGQRVAVLNSHAVPTVQAKDGGPNYKLPERLELYRQHMTGLQKLITEIAADGALVFATGDFNVNYRKDKTVRAKMFPYVRMGRVDTRASYFHLGEPRTGTHVLPNGFDKRLIDYVFNRTDDAVTPAEQSILRGYNSDHRPLLVRYEIEPTAAVAPVDPPGTPTDVVAERGDKQVTLTWSSPAEGGPAETYRVAGLPDDAGTVQVDGEQTTATVTGLTNGRRYTFTVTAVNSTGESEASAPSNEIAPATVPRRMARPDVRVRHRRAIITWTRPPRTGGSPIRGYHVRTAGRTWTTAPDVRRLVVRVPRGRHSVRARAFNVIGNAEWSGRTYYRIRR